MSSATTAAKRRRAGNIVSTPLFKPSSAPMENSVQRRANISQQALRQPVQQTNQQLPQTSLLPENVNIPTNAQRPMSLQQVISVFDKRLLHIEGHILKNGSISNDTGKIDNSVITKDMETLKESIRENLDGQFSEFDHRYQVLANEISSLKQIVLKLQSYSLEINKSLMDERNEILSKLDNVQEKVEETIDASTNTVEEENITFDITSSDVKQEFIENANDVVEDIIENQIAEPKNADDVIEDVKAIDQITESTEYTTVNTENCCNKQECCDGGECCETKDCCNEQECCTKESEEIIIDTEDCCNDSKCCDGGKCCDTKECCNEEECCSKESDKGIENDVSSKNEKIKRKKKQKNVVAVSV